MPRLSLACPRSHTRHDRNRRHGGRRLAAAAGLFAAIAMAGVVSGAMSGGVAGQVALLVSGCGLTAAAVSAAGWTRARRRRRGTRHAEFRRPAGQAAPLRVGLPVRALVPAAPDARRAAELPPALRQSVGRCVIRYAPAGEREPVPAAGPYHQVAGRAPLGPAALRLPDASGGTFTPVHDRLPFARAEFARLPALASLDARLAARVPTERRKPAAYDGGFTVRPAGPDDHAAALALHARCTPQTLARRYHGPVGDADRYLTHLLGPRFGRSLAVETPAGRIMALGHLLWDGDECEVALLVEDAWQGRGIGTALLRGLLELAAEAGRTSVYAVTSTANTPMIATLRTLGLPLDHRVEDATLVVTATVPAPAALPWPRSLRP